MFNSLAQEIFYYVITITGVVTLSYGFMRFLDYLERGKRK